MIDHDKCERIIGKIGKALTDEGLTMQEAEYALEEFNKRFHYSFELLPVEVAFDNYNNACAACVEKSK